MSEDFLRLAPWSRRTLRASLLHTLILLTFCIALAGCKDKKPVVVPDDTPQKSPEEIARENEQLRLEGIRTRFNRAKELIRQQPNEWEQHISNLEARLFEAAGTFLEKDIQAELDGQKQAREKFASDRLAALIPDAKKLVNDQQDYLAAYELLQTLDPDGLLSETKAIAERDELLDWVRRAEDAEIEFNRISKLARSRHRTGVLEEIAKAIGVLESYPDAYKDTNYYSDIREMVDEYMVGYKTMREEELKVTSVPEIAIEIDEYLGNFRTTGEDEVWTGADGVVIGNNTADKPALFQIGEDAWTSWQVRLFLKVPSGQEIHIGGTKHPIKGYSLFPVDLDTDDWVEVMVVFRDGRLVIQNLVTREDLIDPYTPRSSQGGVAIGLSPGDEVEIKDIRVKVFTSIEEEEGADSDDESR